MRHDRSAYALEPYWSREGDDPGHIRGHLRPMLHVCRDCDWRGHGTAAAAEHYVNSGGHDVRAQYARMRDRLAKQTGEQQ